MPVDIYANGKGALKDYHGSREAFSVVGGFMGLFVKQRAPQETDVTRLEEELKSERGKNDVFLIIIRALFYLIKEFSLDLTEIGADKFKQSINALSKKFTSEEKIKRLEYAFEESKQIIISFIKEEKKYFQGRDEEFKNIINLLFEGTNTINEENSAFNLMMYETSSNLEKITHLDDIKKVREALKQEVDQIRRTVKEKQGQDTRRLESLTREVEGLKVDFQRSKQTSARDDLSGLYNRLAFDAHLAKLIEHNVIGHVPFSLLLLNIDDFKRINDMHDHPVGDRVILAVARQCQDLVRKDDFLARYEGEKFAIILPGASLRHGLKKAKSICKSIAAARCAVDSQKSGSTTSFTVSIGVSMFQPSDNSESIVERADKALNEAKRLGKNRVVSEKRLGW